MGRISKEARGGLDFAKVTGSGDPVGDPLEFQRCCEECMCACIYNAALLLTRGA